MFTLLVPLLSLAAVDALCLLSPGPNVLLVSQSAIERSRAHALVVSAGLIAGNLLWACLALSGFAALFSVLPSLQMAVRIAGAVYIIWFGSRLMRATPAPSTASPSAPGAPHAPAGARAFLTGFATSVLNPKALAYFASIFVVFIPAGAPTWLRIASAAVVVADAAICYGAVALLLSTPPVRRLYLALRRPIDRLCGTAMIAFGARLILGRG